MRLINRVRVGMVLLSLCVVHTAVFATVRTSLDLPARSPAAPTGSQFKDQIVSLSRADREEAIYQQIAAGNVPDFMRTMIPITAQAVINSANHTVTYYVTPDYMAIGSNSDFFRMPMSAPLAQRVADLVGGNLPTRKMVNDIWTAATIKLAPSTIPPSAEMITVPVFWQHNTTVETQRASYSLGPLIGGIKKDVVVTSQIATHQAYVAIYGWHYLSGTAIQPLYMGHEATYADYSHGIRIVNQEILVDGAENTVVAVLANANLAALLSDEGAFTSSRYPIPGATPTPTPTPAPTGNVLHWNNFNDGLFTGYTIVTEGTIEGPAAWANASGEIVQSSNVYGPSSAATTNRLGTFAFYNNPAAFSWSNYKLGAILRSTDDDGIGLMFCYQNANNYYKLDLDRQRSFYKLFKKAGGTETTLATQTGQYPSAQDFYVTVEVKNGQIRATLQGAVLFGGPVSDASLTHGTFALYDWGNASSYFDDVLVEELALPTKANGWERY